MKLIPLLTYFKKNFFTTVSVLIFVASGEGVEHIIQSVITL